MMEYLARAELGDDGRGDDPTVQRLEKMAAERMGKPAGLYLRRRRILLLYSAGPKESPSESFTWS